MSRRSPSGARLALTAFAGALAGDLLTKACFVARGPGLVVWNHRDPQLAQRALGSLVAVGVVAVLARLARWRGIDHLGGAWIGVGLLVGGIAGNGLSPSLYARGVPDFVPMPDGWVWDLADFAIGVGLLLALGSFVVGAALAYRRDRIAAD